jgi:exopolysaccharide biosynthesis polyprenyl glycosylphosphotransferase
MLSRRTESSRITLFLLDQVLLIGAFLAAVEIKRRLLPAGEALSFTDHAALYAIAAPFLAIGLWASGLYRMGLEPVWPRLSGGREPLWGGFVALATLVALDALCGLLPAGWARGITPQVTPAVPFLLFGTASLALWLSRLLLAKAGARLSDQERLQMRLVVFGFSRRVLRLLASLQRTPSMGVHVLGVVGEEVPPDVAPALDERQAMALLEQGRVDHILVEAEAIEQTRLEEILAIGDREGISVHITSAMFPSTNLVPSWERIGGVPVLGFVSAELPLGARIVKRSFDIVVAGTGLLVIALPLALVALAIRITSPGPVLYSQERVGVRGRQFKMYKFRSMRIDAEAETGPVWASADDPRCTPLGRWLRRTNVDELPQLLNVLLGHMSLVGPRPERPEFVRDFKLSIRRYGHRHWVKPGITGWAQIHGLRGSTTDLQDRIDHDLYYIENWSLMLDIRILIRTVFDGYLNAA